MINQFFAAKKFILLFKIAFFPSSLRNVEALCKSLQVCGRREKGWEQQKEKKERLWKSREEKREGRGDIQQWEKIVKRRIDGREVWLAQMEKGREGRLIESPLLCKLPLSKSLVFPNNLQPQGRARSLVIVVDRYEREKRYCCGLFSGFRRSIKRDLGGESARVSFMSLPWLKMGDDHVSPVQLIWLPNET